MENKYEKIRTITTTVDGDYFAVSEFNTFIQIWHVKKGFICKLKTDLVSAMGISISISDNGKELLVSGYNNKSVTLYDIDKQKIIWQRKDVNKPGESIILNKSKDLIFINTEKLGAFYLNRKTGETIEKIKKTGSIRESEYNDLDQHITEESSIIKERFGNKTILSFYHKSFALLDSCFSKDSIFCAYSTNPLIAVDTNNPFEEKWSLSVTGHYLKIEYRKVDDKILGIRWDYEKGGSYFLSIINAQNGNLEEEIDIKEPIECSFMNKGNFLITSQGNLYSTIEKNIVNQFDFENK